MHQNNKAQSEGNIVHKGIILSTAYLAPVSYYRLLKQSGQVWIEAHEHYRKQSYRNRTRIISANGVMDLSIPVEKKEGNKTLIRDVRISEHANWQLNHWRAIESAYSSSPFFEYYKDDLRPFYEKKWRFLWDFNLRLQHVVLDMLDMSVEIKPTTAYISDYKNELTDHREDIHPKTELPFEIRKYYQVFQSKFGFLPNMSIIDLLFNMGNESPLILI